MTPNLMIETLTITNSRALIDVHGGDFDSLCLIERNPVALAWGDCEGSVAQYLVRAGVTDYESKLRSLRYALDGNLKSDVPISKQIDTFIDLLVPGRYQLQYHKSEPNIKFIDFESSWDFSTRYDHFYPLGISLIFTQPVDKLNSARVAYYVDRISRGNRPIALTVTPANGWCEFVMDGHHKLQAYRSLKIAPSFITLCRLDAEHLLLSTLNSSCWKDHPMADHYREVKTRYDNT